MQNDNRFWMGVWACITLIALSLIATWGYTSGKRSDALQAMVSAGADPIKSACSLNMEPNQVVCVVNELQVQPIGETK